MNHDTAIPDTDKANHPQAVSYTVGMLRDHAYLLTETAGEFESMARDLLSDPQHHATVQRLFDLVEPIPLPNEPGRRFRVVLSLSSLPDDDELIAPVLRFGRGDYRPTLEEFLADCVAYEELIIERLAGRDRSLIPRHFVTPRTSE
jgi:hypothetical protein